LKKGNNMNSVANVIAKTIPADDFKEAEHTTNVIDSMEEE